jgi:hypothetical protein
LAFLLVLTAGAARAQNEAGLFAAIQGKVEVLRRGSWVDASVGTAIQVGDRVRTGAGDRAKLVMSDDSVLDLAPGTEIIVDDLAFEPDTPRVQSALRLFQGRVRAWVGESYHLPRAHYEIETPTAVAGVRGTEFIASYDVDSEVTEVIGLVEHVDVVGKIAAMGGGKVQVGPQMMTRIPKGRLPTVPQRVDEGRLRQYLQGLELIGSGRRDGLNVLHPVIAGRLIMPDDVPGGRRDEAALAALGDAPPPAPRSQALSLDVYTNAQPLRGFRANPPGRPLTGGVRVGF